MPRPGSWQDVGDRMDLSEELSASSQKESSGYTASPLNVLWRTQRADMLPCFPAHYVLAGTCDVCIGHPRHRHPGAVQPTRQKPASQGARHLHRPAAGLGKAYANDFSSSIFNLVG